MRSVRGYWVQPLQPLVFDFDEQQDLSYFCFLKCEEQYSEPTAILSYCNKLTDC